MAYLFDKGDLIHCRVTFTDPDAASVAVNPGGVTFQVKDPAGVTISYTYGVGVQMVRESTGHYRVDVDATQVGTWQIRWASTGSYQGAAEAQFQVSPTQF